VPERERGEGEQAVEVEPANALRTNGGGGLGELVVVHFEGAAVVFISGRRKGKGM
jgi:hypothetical protein